MKSCRQQAAHLQFLSTLTHFAVCFCCLKNYMPHGLHKTRAWLPISIVRKYQLLTFFFIKTTSNNGSLQFVWQIHKLFFCCWISHVFCPWCSIHLPIPQGHQASLMKKWVHLLSSWSLLFCQLWHNILWFLVAELAWVYHPFCFLANGH